MFRVIMLAALAVVLVSCATPYQPEGLFGGFDVKELRPDVYRVSFGGNGFTTAESAQVYWLHRCAELAVEKGFTGFEVLSDMRFVMGLPQPEDRIGFRLSTSMASLARIPVSENEAAAFSIWREPNDVAGRSPAPVRVAHGGAVIFYGGGGVPKPRIEGDVHFLSTPVEPAPPKIFNARALLAQLDPLINGEKCGGNVCPHVHEYLLPKGKLR